MQIRVGRFLAAVAFGASCLLASGATAGGPWELAGVAGAATDYIYRGVSLTDGHPAVQGSLTLTHRPTGLHAGVWGSRIDFGPGDPARAELFLSAGKGGELAGFGYDVGVQYAVYPGAPAVLHYAYGEGFLSLSREIAGGSVTLSASYTPAYFGDTGPAWFADADAEWPIADGWKALGLIGRAGLGAAAGPRYLFWSVGIARTWNRVTATLRYHGNDLPACDAYCKDRVVLGVTVAF